MHYSLTVAGLLRKLPICQVKDDLYIAGFSVFGDVEVTEACAKALLELAPEYDYLITPEAKSIPLAYEMARRSGKMRYFIARKSPKLYMSGIFATEVNSITTAHTQRLYLDQSEAEMIRGKNMLLVDDVISTGQSINALEKLVTMAGGRIAGRMAVLAEGEAADREDIIFLEKLPLFNADGTIKG
ncbi:MAG: phosphoribosyltransferase family protein [Clostridia bacterium]|jgi:adenine phosphoribosyltransferase|nr:phosphoribosyltransferase family protein [Clostridia bacterium]